MLLTKKVLKKRLKFAAKRALYFGHGRVCPICRRESRRFADFGRVTRHDAQCVWCGSLERHRLAWVYLTRTLGIGQLPSHFRFLHFAPEECIEHELRTTFPGEYVTADLFADNVDLHFDISSIPLPDASVHIIYCSHVLEHVPDDRKAMRELRRILHPQGTAVVMVPITLNQTYEDLSIVDPEERLRVFGQRDHVRRYGPDVKERLAEAGFLVTTATANDLLSPEEVLSMGLSGPTGDIVHTCTPI